MARQAFFRIDEVVVIVGAEVDLHPVDLPIEPAVLGCVVRADRGAVS